MSNRRICVCGRERGKEPVIITITTCRHKHPSKQDGSIIFNSPLATSSATDLKSTKTEKPTKSSLREGKKDSDKTKEKSSDKSELGQSMEGYVADDTTYNTVESDPSRQNETTNNTTYDTANNDTTLEESEISDLSNTRNDTTGVGYGADESSRQNEDTLNESELTGFQTASDSSENDNTTKEHMDNEDNDKSVYFVTETAINTMPFLDNLFWTTSTTSKQRFSSVSMPSISGDYEKQACATEIFIFGKHVKDCKNHFLGDKNEYQYFDGNCYFKSLGKVSFPTCNEDSKSNISQASKVTEDVFQLKDDISGLTTPSTKSKDFFENTLKNLDRYFRTTSFLESFVNGSKSFSTKMNKYITVNDDLNKNVGTEKYEVEELYVKKPCTDRSVQIEDFCIQSKSKKWYDVVLMCLGLKDDEEWIGETVLQEEKPKDSSYQITKYLKI